MWVEIVTGRKDLRLERMLAVGQNSLVSNWANLRKSNHFSLTFEAFDTIVHGASLIYYQLFKDV